MLKHKYQLTMHTGDNTEINKADSVIMELFLKASLPNESAEIHIFPLQQSPGITAVRTQHDKLFPARSQRMEKVVFF